LSGKIATRTHYLKIGINLASFSAFYSGKTVFLELLAFITLFLGDLVQDLVAKELNIYDLNASECRFTTSKVENMDWDRHRYFTLGVVLFLLGIQFRMLDSFVLNEQATRALHRFAKQSQIATTDGMADMYMSVAPSPKKTVKPPHWIGWVLLTVGCVVSLHALAMPRRQ
jgi:hypothetical protein